MRALAVSASACCLLSFGCVSVKPVVEPGNPAARIVVSTNLPDVKNVHVRYHGDGHCGAEATLIAMINSVAIGVEGGNPVRAQIPAGGVQIVSVLGMAPTRQIELQEILLATSRERRAGEEAAAIRERFLAFSPRPGGEYVLKFDWTGTDVTLTGEEIDSNRKVLLTELPLPASCQAKVR